MKIQICLLIFIQIIFAHNGQPRKDSFLVEDGVDGSEIEETVDNTIDFSAFTTTGPPTTTSTVTSSTTAPRDTSGSSADNIDGVDDLQDNDNLTTATDTTITITRVKTEEKFIATGTPANKDRLTSFCSKHRKKKCTCDCAQWERRSYQSLLTRLGKMAKRYLFIGLNSIIENPEECLEKSNWQHLYKFTVPVGLWGEMKIGVAIDKSKWKEISIWISGSSNIEYFASANPKQGGKLQELDNQTLELFHPFCNESVHVGNLILKGYFAAHKRLGKVLKELKDKYGNDHTILFNGHSIGACVAQMLAMSTVRELGWNRCCVKAVGYGNPRCGDQNFAAMFMENVHDPYQFNWLFDPIKDFPSKANDDHKAHFDRSRPKNKRTFLHAQLRVDVHYSNDSSAGLENLWFIKHDTDADPKEYQFMGLTKDLNLLYRNHYGFFGRSDAFLNQTCINE